MQFKVPQFLEIEDKIFGPFTFKQFVYLVGGAGLCYILYKSLGILISIIPIFGIAGITLALTFYRPNGKPFVNMIEAGIRYAMRDKLYIWKKHLDKVKARQQEVVRQTTELKNETMSQNGVRLNGDKLRDLAWSLNILDLQKDNNGNN